MLVDDNIAVRTLVHQLFESEPSFEVVGEAENGREAIEKADNLKPDLVILDLTMPVMNGFDAAAELMRRLPAMKIILFTVEEGPEVERLARQAGVQAVISKDRAAQLIPQSYCLLGLAQGDSGPLENAS